MVMMVLEPVAIAAANAVGKLASERVACVAVIAAAFARIVCAVARAAAVAVASFAVLTTN